MIFECCTMARVQEWLILVGFTIARLWEVHRLLYKQGARMLTCGKNVRFLESSRRRNFHGEVASKWFGSYSLSWFSGIILTSSPYPLQLIKGEELSWRKLVVFGLGLLAWLEWLWDLLCQDRLWVAIRSMVSKSLEKEVYGEWRTVGRDLTTSRPWL